MIPLKIELKEGETVEGRAEELRKMMLETAAKMGLSPAQEELVRKNLDDVMADLRRDGAAKTTAKALIACIKDAEKVLETAPVGMMSLGKMVPKGKQDASVYLLGGIGSDVVTAMGLLSHARSRLRDLLDADPWAEQKAPEKKPEAAQ